jgi:hypothetical protein
MMYTRSYLVSRELDAIQQGLRNISIVCCLLVYTYKYKIHMCILAYDVYMPIPDIA